ncbi:MAG: ECF transporter S component [Clostridiales bacterium]|nr:ECF transporter S component [Clostridiales bacterium]
MVTLAMIAALAYLLMLVIRIPVFAMPPLKYEPKDVAITIAGFMFGPVSAFLVSLVVSLVEMVTVSETGWIGAVMNLVSTCSFACMAAYIYKKNHTLKGAVIGLVCGIVSMVIVMLLWNYILTPIYMGYPREAVAPMLPTVFLPFNLLKGVLNAAFVMLLYKPLVITLRKAGLVAPSAAVTKENAAPHKIRPGVVLISAALIITCILIILALTGKI